MAQFIECEHCGSHLDTSEKCNCQEPKPEVKKYSMAEFKKMFQIAKEDTIGGMYQKAITEGTYHEKSSVIFLAGTIVDLMQFNLFSE